MSLASSLAPIQPKLEATQAQTEKRPAIQQAKSESPAAKGAKYTDPDFMQLKVYVRRKTKIAAAHKWENNGGRELSELIETLLNQYLST